MPEIEETLLPGVGVRREFTSAGGERVALLMHRTGRRELAIYDRDDPDVCHTVLHLSAEDTATLGEMLGTGQGSETRRGVQHLEGVVTEWITVEAGSTGTGGTIADEELRTGASIIAIARGDFLPAPEPDVRLAAGDVVIAVGTPPGLARLRTLLGS